MLEKIEGISDIRDESDRDGIRIVIELKKDANAQVVENNLFSKTALQSRFSGNMVALVQEGRKPERINILKALKIFIEFRFNTIKRRTEHHLKKLDGRSHILEGVATALLRVDEVIDIMKHAKDAGEVRSKLMEPAFGFSTTQADAILNLRLSRLTSLETKKLELELAEIKNSMSKLRELLANDSKVFDLIKEETSALLDKYPSPRRSVIATDLTDVSEIDLLPNARSVIILTASGYVKRMSMSEFGSQNRGTKGKIGANLKGGISSEDGDKVLKIFSCHDHDTILFITNRGVARGLPTFKIPLCSRTARGAPIPSIIPLRDGESITATLPLKASGNLTELLMLTRLGQIKKTSLSEFANATTGRRSLTILKLHQNDSLQWARITGNDEDVIVGTRGGFVSRFSVSKIKSTRAGVGVRGIKLRPGDEICDMDVLTAEAIAAAAANSSVSMRSAKKLKSDKAQYLLAVTATGVGKRLLISEISPHGRNSKGIYVIKLNSTGSKTKKSGASKTRPADSLRCLRVCAESDNFVISTEQGVIAQQRVSDIGLQKRKTYGFLIQKVRDGDSVAMVDVVKPNEDDVTIFERSLLNSDDSSNLEA